MIWFGKKTTAVGPTVVGVKRPIVKATTVAVSAELDQVVLKIGSSEMRFHYEDALALSQWLRVRAKQAKAFAGDHSRHWSALGVLTDAEKTRG